MTRLNPLFARYIKGQGVDPENPKCVVMAVFFKDRRHLLEGREFLKVLRELEELNTEGCICRRLPKIVFGLTASRRSL